LGKKERSRALASQTNLSEFPLDFVNTMKGLGLGRMADLVCAAQISLQVPHFGLQSRLDLVHS
jgi:hypothetical protein